MEHALSLRGASAGVGLSLLADADEAAAEALSAAMASGEAPPQLAIVYATVTHDQTRLLAARLPGVPIVGASSAGVSVSGKVTDAPRCVVVAVLRSATVRARAAVVEGIAADPAAAGRELGRKLGVAPDGPTTTLLWYDPLTGVNMAALLAGLAEGGYPVVFGGGAGQPYGPRIRTFQYFGERVLNDSAVALAIDGLSPTYDMTHGTEPMGIELTVTQATDNIIEQLDGQPALDVCCEQLGLEAIDQQSSNWTLGFKPPEGTLYEGLFTRGIFGTDPVKRTITLQAPIAVGSRVQVCVRTRDAVLERALAMGRRLGAALAGKKPVLALAFECAARPQFAGPRVSNQAVVEVQALIGPDIPWIGMFAWGEVAPLGGRAEFHNYTLPLCVLCEEP